MLASTAQSLVLTAVFVVTGVYTLARLARAMAGENAPENRLVELFHLFMSVAMIQMVWAWVGGPETTGGIVQIVFFGAFTAWFAFRTARRGRLANGYHLAMAAAMTWMVAAMPLIMGSSGGTSGGGGHHAAPPQPSEVDSPPTPAAGWVVAVTIAFVVLLVIATCWWVLRAVRARPLATRTPVALAARIDAGCHVLMSLGMAGMLVAML